MGTSCGFFVQYSIIFMVASMVNTKILMFNILGKHKNCVHPHLSDLTLWYSNKISSLFIKAMLRKIFSPAVEFLKSLAIPVTELKR